MLEHQIKALEDKTVSTDLKPVANKGPSSPLVFEPTSSYVTPTKGVEVTQTSCDNTAKDSVDKATRHVLKRPFEHISEESEEGSPGYSPSSPKKPSQKYRHVSFYIDEDNSNSKDPFDKQAYPKGEAQVAKTAPVARVATLVFQKAGEAPSPPSTTSHSHGGTISDVVQDGQEKTATKRKKKSNVAPRYKRCCQAQVGPISKRQKTIDSRSGVGIDSLGNFLPWHVMMITSVLITNIVRLGVGTDFARLTGWATTNRQQVAECCWL